MKTKHEQDAKTERLSINYIVKHMYTTVWYSLNYLLFFNPTILFIKIHTKTPLGGKQHTKDRVNSLILIWVFPVLSILSFIVSPPIIITKNSNQQIRLKAGHTNAYRLYTVWYFNTIPYLSIPLYYCYEKRMSQTD